jgi:hypothetical protein
LIGDYRIEMGLWGKIGSGFKGYKILWRAMKREHHIN